MRKLYTILSIFFLSNLMNAQDPDAFIMIFEVTGQNLEIIIPIVQDNTNNYTVNFGDSTVLNNQTGNVSHTYATAGVYTVSLTGTFGHINFSNLSNSYRLKLKSIEQWGSNHWTSMQYAFHGCSNLIINATDAPDLSQTTDMSSMLSYTSSFNQPINHWDVSNVANMTKLFEGSSSFNQSLNNWDVSNITNMSYMFSNASSFNQSLNNWNVSNVTNMSSMFSDASSFDQPLNNWNVSNVTNMSFMFFEASSFNQPLNNWNVSNVTNMGILFYNATSFDQPLNNWNFNPNVVFSEGFLSNSGLSVTNYDLLLQRFFDLELQNKFIGAEAIEYCNINARNNLIENLGWTITGDNLSDNCNHNIITGNIFYNENNTGCEVGSVQINNVLITSTNELSTSATFSNSEGQYNLYVNEGAYTINILNIPDYFSYNTIDTSITFEGSGNVESLDFCLTTNQTVQDLNIVLLPITEARPGFEADYQLVVQNIGTQTVNDISVSLAFDSTMQSFVSADLNTNSITTDELNFEITSLPPFGSTIVNFTMQTFTPPTVNGDDVLNFTATVTPNTNDYTPNDNTFELAQTVVNSYDPNDKQVLQGSEIHIDDVNEYLHYLIRFQNTGTASAIHVRIEDQLHESLDWNTIQILSSSHNYRVEITDGNQVEFIFENIYLPYEDQDEEGSNSFIAYKIKPVEGLQVGDIITGNEAYIYFDYNLPIITNTTSTEVVNPTSGISQHKNDLISVYPNPTNGTLHIQSKGNVKLEAVKIYNLQGRELFFSNQNLDVIDIEDLSSGVYLLNIKTNEGTISQRIIRK